jgi:hypothetical protein
MAEPLVLSPSHFEVEVAIAKLKNKSPGSDEVPAELIKQEAKYYCLGSTYLLTYLLTYSMALLRKRTILTERPSLVGEVSANFCGERVPRGQRDRSLRPYSPIYRPNLLCKSYKSYR